MKLYLYVDKKVEEPKGNLAVDTDDGIVRYAILRVSRKKNQFYAPEVKAYVSKEEYDSLVTGKLYLATFPSLEAVEDA